MLSDADVMEAAEAVVKAYLLHLFPLTAVAAAAAGDVSTSSQDAAILAGSCAITKQGLVLSHSDANECLGKRSSALRLDAQALFVLSCVVDMVKKGLRCTERDVYYRNTWLFQNGQKDAHTSIERVCRWMDCARPLFFYPNDAGLRERRYYTREDMRIGASGKSILIGNLSFDVPACPDNSVFITYPEHGVGASAGGDAASSVRINVDCHNTGVLLNAWIALRGCHFRSAASGGALPSALVIVEKESTLRMLVGTQAFPSVDAPLCRYVFLCSKGYPCRSSRVFLRNIHRELPTLPIVALVDGDPHGLRIALTFLGLFGEGAKSQRGGYRRRGLPAGDDIRTSSALLPARWVGVRPSALPHSSSGCAPLTLHDKQVLSQVTRRVNETLSLFRCESDELGVGGEDAEVIRLTLSDVLQEAEWMGKRSVKCAMQAWAENPLAIIDGLFF